MYLLNKHINVNNFDIHYNIMNDSYIIIYNDSNIKLNGISFKININHYEYTNDNIYLYFDNTNLKMLTNIESRINTFIHNYRLIHFKDNKYFIILSNNDNNYNKLITNNNEIYIYTNTIKLLSNNNYVSINNII